MKVRLDSIRFEPFSWQETCDIPVASLDSPELVALSPVDWRGQIAFADPGFLLRGRLRYEQTLVCTRCLTNFAEPVDGEVQAMLVPAAPEKDRGRDRTKSRDGGGESGGGRSRGVEGDGPGGGEGDRLDEQDLGVYEVAGEEFDSDPLVREQLQLNVPMKPLCRRDCKGLCPRCGADWNQGPCDCPPQVDERWSALAALRDRLEPQ